MMVASTSSLMNFQQARQQGFIPEPTAPDMEYRMQRHDNKHLDTRGIFNSQNNSFTGIAESKCPPPTYQEAVERNMNGGRVYVSPSQRDLCYSDLNNNGSISPSVQKYSPHDMGISAPMSQHKYTGPQSQLSPPSKRSAVSRTNRYPSNRTLSPPLDADYESPGFSSSNGQCEDMQMEDCRGDGQFLTFGRVSGAPAEDQNLYEPLHLLQATGPQTEDDGSSVSISPDRRRSLSSTRKSGGALSRSTSAKLSKTPAKTQPLQFLFDDDDDDSWKICSVCGDKATGYHFNALTCEGCKGFFRRSMKNGKSFTCPYSGNCSITKSNRRQCQACRLDKCLKIGMKKECIMSRAEIEMKKNLMLNNRIKRSIVEWKPIEYTQDRRELVELLSNSFRETNNPPDIQEEEGIVTVSKNPAASPASSSTSSGFSDLINQMTQDIVATAPNQNSSKAHLRHFSAIMAFSIKEIIKFCKKIPAFVTLSLKDQITLLKSGCTEILFIRANFTYDREQNALMCGPNKYYTRESFILGGMSEEYTDSYLQFHHDLSYERLDDTELACLCAATLFSSDRDELEKREIVEIQQEEIVIALQSHTENTHNCRTRFPKIMAYLTRLRTLNWHISQTLQRLQDTEDGKEITPLVLEVVPTV